MDSLTHTVLGACLGQVIAGKKIGKKAMLWGAIANNIPDIDVITSAWMGQADSLLAHRYQGYCWRSHPRAWLFSLFFFLLLLDLNMRQEQYVLMNPSTFLFNFR